MEYKKIDLDNDSSFKEYLRTNPTGLKIVPIRRDNGFAEHVWTDEFVEWLRKKKNINVDYEECTIKLILGSNELLLPLVFLADDITLSMYLNMVADYVYERLSNTTLSESALVKFEVIYKEQTTGETEHIRFSGSKEKLSSVI